MSNLPTGLVAAVVEMETIAVHLAVVGTEDGIEVIAGPVMDASQEAMSGAALAPNTPPALNGL